ncbi:MAG: beta-ketoacyl-ACP synthase III [Anaeroplasmataceae bacterium]
MSKIEIVGMGSYVPSTVVSNDDLSKIMDTSDEWIKTRTGITNRHYATDENTKDMAIKASIEAFRKTGISPNDIDLVIVATITGDDITPSVACKILKELNIRDVMAFDINAACSGFIYALNTASALMEANDYKYALVIGAEKLTKLLDYSDRSTAILFGDGAAATIVRRSKKKAYFSCFGRTDELNVLQAPGITQNGIFKNSVCNDFYLTMNGQEVYKFAISASIEAINSVLDKASLTLNDISLIVPHQANIRIIEAISKRLKLDMDKFYTNVSEYGNTSAASIPLALNEVLDKKILKKGDKIILVGFGSGLTYAASIIEI